MKLRRRKSPETSYEDKFFFDVQAVVEEGGKELRASSERKGLWEGSVEESGARGVREIGGLVMLLPLNGGM